MRASSEILKMKEDGGLPIALAWELRIALRCRSATRVGTVIGAMAVTLAVLGAGRHAIGDMQAAWAYYYFALALVAAGLIIAFGWMIENEPVLRRRLDDYLRTLRFLGLTAAQFARADGETLAEISDCKLRAMMDELVLPAASKAMTNPFGRHVSDLLAAANKFISQQEQLAHLGVNVLPARSYLPRGDKIT